MKKKMIAKLSTLLTIVTVSLASTAFVAAAPGHVHTNVARKQTTLRVGYVPISGLLGMYAAIERGYFRHEGLRLQLTPMAGAAVVLPALEGGSLDIGTSNPVTTLLAASHGLQPVEITHGQFEDRRHPTNAILVMAGSTIHNAKDLEGKTVAVNALNGVAQIGFEQWMQDHGGNPALTHFTEVSFPEMVAPLTHHQIDAAVEAEPFVTIGKSLGARVLAYHFASERIRTLLGGFMATRPWAQGHQSLIKSFTTAYNRGQRWVNSHLSQARPYLTKYARLQPSLARRIPLPTVTKIKASDLNYWMRLAIRWHVLAHTVRVKTLIWSTAQ